MLEESFGVKERRACRVVGQNRSTQRLAVPLPSDDEQELRRWLVTFSAYSDEVAQSFRRC